MRGTHEKNRRSTHPRVLILGLGTLATLACTGQGSHETLAELRHREPDLTEAPIDDGIDQAMAGYRKFLAETPRSALTPEAMRRLADLKLEKEYGLLGSLSVTKEASSESTADLPTPDRIAKRDALAVPESKPSQHTAQTAETEADFEARATGGSKGSYAEAEGLSLPGGAVDSTAGPLEAIELYDQILEAYPNYPQTDQVLYQKARAYDELGRVDEGIAVAQELVDRFPASRHIDEIEFRRAEYYFTRKKYLTAEKSYSTIVEHGPGSGYYELALYKLGWSLYKQMMLEEALESYVTLLDHKVASGYDFDQIDDETEEQRIADTYRVMSLCFSDLGGAAAVTDFFGVKGKRSYEDRVYRHLGEFYLEKRRYNDAASAYEAFVELNPTHKNSPHFSMRVVEIYEAGEFPKLVLASKKKFAESYGLASAYWTHFDPSDVPEVLEYLKGNLEDLANHYHALYQNTDRPEDKPAHFAESAIWYRAFLNSFPEDPETPAIHYQLADLRLQNEDFEEAAGEYEKIAYGYPSHERSAAAGYAAIFANRQFEKQTDDSSREAARRESVASTLRFVDGFPDHEHAAAVFGAAIDDLYDLKEYAQAIANAHRLLDEFPEAAVPIRRAAWTVIAHASFDTEQFATAEDSYAQVLELTPEDNATKAKIMNNLAASIYKQGEQARAAQDYRSAADHFLRIARAAPRSEIRPIAEYDAAAALIELDDWSGAASVLESFRDSYPEHELNREATQQIAFVYREDGNLGRAAEEYERVAGESTEPELRRESLLVAAELYEEAELITKALATYGAYVTEFTQPIEPAVVARSKMADLYQKTGNEVSRRAELERIVAIDRAAGESRTDGVRLIAARSALILSERSYERFAEVELTLPFEKSLQQKKERMNAALGTFGGLLDYEVGEVTAAATYYMAEVYGEFSRALLESERPTDLDATDRENYEMVLEEEAYPFEEKAIDVHEKNLELMKAGVFNAWIEKSLARLAVVMPGRYAKFDASTGLIESISSYTYRTPRSTVPPANESEPGPQMDIEFAQDEVDEEIQSSPDSPASEATAASGDDEASPQEAFVPNPTPSDEMPPAAPAPSSSPDESASVDRSEAGQTEIPHEKADASEGEY